MTALATVLPLRRSTPPQTEPPHDDEVGAVTRRAAKPMLGSLALPLDGFADTTVPRLPPRVARRRDHLSLVPDVADQPTSETADPAGSLPEATAWCRRLVPALVEVLSGDRPLSQVSGWLTPRVQESVRRRVAAMAQAAAPQRALRQRAVVRSLHVSQPVVGVVEACATVRRGDRMAALALRLEDHSGRWKVTVIQPGWSPAG